jgi:hypothetical protein
MASVALAVILAATIVSACSQEGRQEESTDPTVEATASPSATPEPTIAPADAFVAYLTEGHFTATADLSGTMAVNDQEPLTLIGEWTVSGGDFHTVLDFGEAGGRVEQAVVDGQNYVRQPPMPWKRDIEASIPPFQDFAGVLAGLNWQPADQGSASVGDALLAASGSRIETAMTLLGLVDQSVEVEHGTLTVQVDRRGVPTEIHLEADVHRLAGDPLSIEWDLVYVLRDVGRLTTVKKPEVWLPHESDLKYAMHHPHTWSVTSEPATAEYVAYDLYLSPISGELHVSLFDGLDPGVPANIWLQGSAASFTEWAGPPEESETLTVAGAPALFLGTHGSDQNGEWWIMQVSIIGVGRAWDIQFWSAPGTETYARETLDQFLATFQMAET